MKRKAQDGIALLSMYNDDDDDSEEEQAAPANAEVAAQEQDVSREDQEHEVVPREETAKENGSSQMMDQILADFLPPPPTSKCSDELQNKLARYVALKDAGRSFNEELRNSKGYRNPDFLQHAVLYQGVDQIGSCFKPEVFNPREYAPEDFSSAIAGEQKRVYDRREQEMKENQRLEFARAQGQASLVDPRAAVQLMQRGNVAAAPAPPVKAEGRVKRSKWDKVDSDTKTATSVSTAAATSQATLLNSQQAKRKEENKLHRNRT